MENAFVCGEKWAPSCQGRSYNPENNLLLVSLPSLPPQWWSPGPGGPAVRHHPGSVPGSRLRKGQHPASHLLCPSGPSHRVSLSACPGPGALKTKQHHLKAPVSLQGELVQALPRGCTQWARARWAPHPSPADGETEAEGRIVSGQTRSCPWGGPGFGKEGWTPCARAPAMGGPPGDGSQRHMGLLSSQLVSPQ